MSTTVYTQPWPKMDVCLRLVYDTSRNGPHKDEAYALDTREREGCYLMYSDGLLPVTILNTWLK